jgi:hydrogenase maturation protein HypF
VGLTAGKLCYLSAEIGDLDGQESLKVFRETVQDLGAFFHIEPSCAVCDLHPDYASSQFSWETRLPVLEVQHHFAHIASVLAEHNVSESVIGVAFDGTGYGTDGTVWGGEFLIAGPDGFARAGHLKAIKMLGGDASVRQNWKTAACLLEDAEFDGRDVPQREKLVLAALRSGVNVIRSSSMGRVFDAVSALLGFCEESSYEGQGAVELENAAAAYKAPPDEETGPLPFDILRDGEGFAADLAPCIRVLAAERVAGADSRLLAVRFHHTVSRLITDMCVKIREERGIARVAMSGGVFQNRILLEETVPALVKAGFEVLLNEKVPPNDGGIALGQAWAACHMIKKQRSD